MTKSENKDKGKKSAKLPKGSGKVLGYGVVFLFLLVWVFALGVLTGRGDIHRWLQRAGLYKTEVATRLGVAVPPTDPPNVPILPNAAGAKIESEAVPPVVPETQAAAPPVAATSVAANNAAPPPSAPAPKAESSAKADSKKGKGLTPPKVEQQKSIAAKLNFQNSLDTQTKKPAKTATKKEKNVQAATMVPNPADPAGSTATAPDKKKPAAAYQVKVASFRDAAEAQKALTDLNKKGVKVILHQGKDKTGPTFVIQTPRLPSKAEAEKVAKKLREAKMTGQIQEVKP